MPQSYTPEFKKKIVRLHEADFNKNLGSISINILVIPNKSTTLKRLFSRAHDMIFSMGHWLFAQYITNTVTSEHTHMIFAYFT